MKGKWEGAWSEDKNSFKGTYTFPDGRTFVGSMDWVTEVKRQVHDTSGRIIDTVKMPVLPHWEPTGSWVRRDGKGASAPHMPEPPEERDNGEPPPEEC